MTYLNNAAAGWPKAPGVAEAVRRALEEAPSEPGRANTEPRAWVEHARGKVAKFLGVEDASRIVFSLNATHALNTAIRGLDLPAGALVVTTAAEHNSILRPLAHLRRERGIRVRIAAVEADGSVCQEDYAAALHDGPALVALSHASNVTGIVQDAARLLGLAKAAGAATLLDASQSAGHIPLCARTLGADLLVFQAHKGLHGPEGVGVLYVAGPLELQQVVTGGTGVRSDLEFHPSEMPSRLEAGTANSAGLAGFMAALDWYEKDGLRHARRAASQALRIRQALSEMPGVRVFGPAPGSRTTPVVSFCLPDFPVQECGFILRECFHIIARTGLHCAPLIHSAIGSAPEGTVRFSPSGFTSEAQVEAAIRGVQEVARCALPR